MITCVIKYEIDPYKVEAFEEYARRWGQAIPQCGAELVGYFAPHEGSATTAYGIYSVADLAAYESYRARLKAHPLGQENYALLAASSSFGRKSGSSSGSPPPLTPSLLCRSQHARVSSPSYSVRPDGA